MRMTLAILATCLVLTATACAATTPRPTIAPTLAPEEPAPVVAAPAASSVATIFGADPVDVARRQLSAEASASPARFSAELVATTTERGVKWAHVTVSDTHVPPGFEIEQVLLRTDATGRFYVLVHGSGLELPAGDAAFYGLSAGAARRLFP